MNVMTMIFLLLVMAIMLARMMTMKPWPDRLTRQCAWGGLVIQ